jgi:hypothetical protein
MVSLFLKVTVAQFRRDFLSALTVEKSKALRIKVVERQTSSFHLRLKSELVESSAPLEKFKKSDLHILCLARQKGK